MGESDIYLTPRIRCFSLYSWDGACSNDFLIEVAQKCPRLQEVEFFRVGTQINAEQLFAFLSPMTQLSTVHLGFLHLEGHCQVTGDLLMHLSQLQTLEDLYLGNYLHQPELFEAVRQQSKTPFQCLKRIGLNVGASSEFVLSVTFFANSSQATSSVISAAVLVLPVVEDAYFNILDSNGLCLQDLVLKKDLQSLRIATPRDMIFARKDLLALTAFKKLRSITIRPFDDKSKSPFVEDFSDSDFDSLVSAWPDLESMEWYMRWDKRTMAALSSLSKHCPKLACLTLKSAFELQILNNLPAPLFPRLRELSLENWTVRSNQTRLTPLQIARLVDNHAPKLKSLRFTRTNASPELVSAWEKL